MKLGRRYGSGSDGEETIELCAVIILTVLMWNTYEVICDSATQRSPTLFTFKRSKGIFYYLCIK